MIRFIARLQKLAVQAGVSEDMFLALVAGMLAWTIAHALRAAFGG